MPRRTDLRHVLIIGSGPIVIGQACEFDYSGTQACRALRQEGLRVSLINSNPATIMTDPEFADATYVEPVTPEFVEKVIDRERPDALLATLGGQTALNTAVTLAETGVLARYGVELIGADLDAIRRGEDRQLFKDVVAKAGARIGFAAASSPCGEDIVLRSRVCRSMAEVVSTVEELGLPVVVRPSYTLGGLGSGLARTDEELERLAGGGLTASPVGEVLIEESVLGWKEYELELMRDRDDNVVVVCCIENVDPMGVHTGDSVTVAPAMTLTDREYQAMRDLGIAVLREVGVDTGGCNIQFAVEPETGRMVVIEMNPRVSRSSALASKATGFPIAEIAAKLAIGYTLAEIPNDITRSTPAAFEPALDYVVVKMPRFAFEKFPDADTELSTTMKSVGEAMAIGRTFAEALTKAMRSLETPATGFWTTGEPEPETAGSLLAALRVPHDGRLHTVERALRAGVTVTQVAEASGIDAWFVDQIAVLVELRARIVTAPELDPALLRDAKRAGLSDEQLGALRPELDGEGGVRALRERLGVFPVYKTVDTCAAEFAASTPYHYSCYEEETEVALSARAKVLILGSGPNRIGQGIEFDYSCVHAAMSLREAGYETVMVNCNPETVSTDYRTADRLYFEPLTFEDVFEVYRAEHESGLAAGGPGVAGVVVQLGGQTPVGLARELAAAGLPVVGTTPDAIHSVEDRGVFGELVTRAGLLAPRYGMARSFAEAERIADEIGYPVLVRPSYVLGGRGMELAHDRHTLERYIARATDISPRHPVLVDRFLAGAVEIDVDALADATGEVYLGGVMEHLEEAGIHSGDSACVLPPVTLTPEHLAEVRRYTTALARHIGVCGLFNVQYALQGDDLYVLEVNPRASRTVPFVCKVTGTPLAKAAARIMFGATIAELRAEGLLARSGDGGLPPASAPFAVKEAILPFGRFRTPRGEPVNDRLGPEMKSTGEVMATGPRFADAYLKAQTAARGSVNHAKVVVTVLGADGGLPAIERLAHLGFTFTATPGTAELLRAAGIACAEEPAADGVEQAVARTGTGAAGLVLTPRVDPHDGQLRFDVRTLAVTGTPGTAPEPGAEAERGVPVRSLQEVHAALRSEAAATPTPRAA
ncbi:carbamoyl-phosphate synthase large subunit [Amycolatopsis sp. NPDC051716]|uniref:carbamoyl-phosphate synthase large subunit n=1 Tax=Amycolatopsis sp. NPDC051716 TaxID=3155804 RepID=UPI0034191AC8